MNLNRFKIFISLFIDREISFRFFMLMVFGVAFSIAVILSTIGLMDGFDRSLKLGLKKSVGDISITSRGGEFFKVDDELVTNLNKNKISQYSTLVQSESFLIFNEESKGVLVKGVDHFYREIVKLPIDVNEDEAIIGSELANLLNVKIGDEITLSFAKGNENFKNLPSLNRFKVTNIIEHGIYQKDVRIVYINLNRLQQILELGNFVNMVSLNVDGNVDLDEKVQMLRNDLGHSYVIRPYWKEFSSLIEAVKVEKIMISIILQTVVVIAIFNIIAFIIFVNEKKSKELFLFKALGLSQRTMKDLWLKLVVFIWILACLLSVILIFIFRLMLLYLPIFKLPAEIYYMPRIELFISYKDYALVFFMALVWILILTYYLLRKISKKSLLEGLRQEFA